MAHYILWSFASVVVVSLISLVGILGFIANKNVFRKSLLFLVSFSAGALFSDAFIHLLPEAAKAKGFTLEVSAAVIFGIALFFFIEKIIKWRHCHELECKEHTKSLGYMNLIGDGVHNLIDGLIIGGSYLASIPLGIATTLAVIFHEIPQEIGDFGVLLHSGFSTKKALLFNFLSALTAVVGVAAVLALGDLAKNYAALLVPFAAGSFIYIAGSDLIPELHKETRLKVSLLQLIAFVLGVLIIASFLLLE
jgi:zinc and cadmium transporter